MRWLTMLLGVSTLAGVAPKQDRPARVDLRAQQTPIRNQGQRTTCITFAATAALEAAYKRAGHAVDLSEEFCNYMGKTFWLHPVWDKPKTPDQIALKDKGPGWAENQVGAFAGGGSVGYLQMLAKGFALPEERLMPYRTDGYSRLIAGHDWTDAYWHDQRNVDNFNLNPSTLPWEALTAEHYYSVKSLKVLDDPKDPAQYEAALVAGHEISTDFDLTGDLEAEIWQPDPSKPKGAHAMLIVGYDRTNKDARFHHFIVKNSWGPTTTPRGDGFTFISYAYVKSCALKAAYIAEVNPPRAWPELAFVGRWHLSFDGHDAYLNIYHLPGLSQIFFDEAGLKDVVDRRLGTLYVGDKPYRVNGAVQGTHLTFYFDAAEPNLRWDALQGRKFDYYLFSTDKEGMAGMHQDPDKRSWGGWARKSGSITAPATSPEIAKPESYLGEWAFVCDGYRAKMTLGGRDDESLPKEERAEWAAVTGRLETRGQEPIEIVVRVSKKDPSLVRLDFTASDKLGYSLTGRHLSHQRGVVAGSGTSGAALKLRGVGFYFYRTR